MTYKKAKLVSVVNIDDKYLKENVIIVGLVDKIVQTGGPTIFVLIDGTGNLSLKGFISPGNRAYPEINEGDYVETEIKVNEFQGSIEGDILWIKKKVGMDMERIKSVIAKQQVMRAKVVNNNFMLKNNILEKLRIPITRAAEEIRLAVVQCRPIVVRHHNDTDGYCSGFALERAIIPLIEKQHGTHKAAWEYFKRAPSMAPFYELEDSIKDTTMSLRDVAKFSAKMPLIIIADNGSSPEDLMAIQQAKIHGADVIVIDHHDFDKDVISPEVIANINPHLVGESGNNISAGMLCAEVARFVNETLCDNGSNGYNVDSISAIPALSGFADKIDITNPDLVNAYLKIAEANGYTKKLLEDISLVIEYVSTKVRFMESREYISVLFGEPRDKQKKLVSLMAPYIKNLDKKGLAIGKSSAKIEELENGITLQTIEIEKSFPGFGFFPKPGRSIGLLHDSLQTDTDVKSLVSIAIMNTAMSFRATDEANFSTHELISALKEKLPNAFIDGGGHKNAGAINFIPKMREKVFDEVKKFIGK